MPSFNKAIVLGNLGRDPEVRYAQSGAAVCNLRIATTRTWKSRDSGERQEETEWHSVVLYERQAEIAGEYLKKGSSVLIEGRLKTRKWQDKDGNDRYTTEIVGESMQLLGSREGGNSSEGGGQQRQQPAYSNNGGRTQGQQGNQQRQQQGNQQRQQQQSRGGLDEMDDDIPF